LFVLTYFFYVFAPPSIDRQQRYKQNYAKLCDYCVSPHTPTNHNATKPKHPKTPNSFARDDISTPSSLVPPSQHALPKAAAASLMQVSAQFCDDDDSTTLLFFSAER
jgi:hypothetical protein